MLFKGVPALRNLIIASTIGMVLILVLACSVGTPAATTPDTLPTSAGSDGLPTSLASHTPGATEPITSPTQTNSGQSESTDPQVRRLTPDCLDADGIGEIRAEYAANHLRAKETYIGERVCLRGTLSGFSRTGDGVGATVGDEARFSLDMERQLGTGRRDDDYEAWDAWVMASSVGDTIEAECEIMRFTPTEQSPKRTPGIPLFTDCQLFVRGEVWRPPTPTPLPCEATELGDPSFEWIRIDCPAGKVTVGRGGYDVSEEFDFLSDGDSTSIALRLTAPGEFATDDDYKHRTEWRRWVEEPQGQRGAKELWEAPPDIAALIISRWRQGAVDEMSVSFGECCSVDMHFRLSELWDEKYAE